MENPWQSFETKEARQSGKGVGLLEKAVDILDAVGSAPGQYRSAELMDIIGMPRSSFYRVAHALVRRGLLRTDGEDQTYHLGYRFLGMAKRDGFNHNIIVAAEAQLRRLRDLAGETVYLCILDGEEVVVLDRYDSPYDIRSRTKVGGRKPLYCSSEGKAFLAFLRREKVKELLPRLSYERKTGRTICDPESLDAQLSVIKFRGYATDEGEALDGVRCIGAPILNDEGVAVAAIGVAGPMFRFSSERAADVGTEAVAAAKRIAETLAQLGSGKVPKGLSTKEATRVARTRSLVAFAPIWNERDATVCWVDPMGPALYSCRPEEGTVSVARFDRNIVAVFSNQDGGLVAAVDRELVTLDDNLQLARTVVSLDAVPATHRIASARTDSKGRIWMLVRSRGVDKAASSLWMFDGEGPPSRRLDKLTVAPGMGWSPDGRVMYFADSENGRILGYDLDGCAEEPALPSVGIPCASDGGRPMGIAVDSKGRIWCAQWDGWCVTCYLPSGEIVRTVPLPVPRPSGCVLGGSDGTTLYVVTSRLGLSARFLGDVPDSGTLYSIQT